MTIAPDLDPDPRLAALAAASRPPMHLDPQAVLGAAHRHTHRRTAGRVVASVAAVAAVTAVAVNVADVGGRTAPAWRTTNPTSTEQVAQAIGEGDLAIMGAGVRAVNLPGPAAGPAAGALAVVPHATAEHDLGLTGPGGSSLAMITAGPDSHGSASLLVTYTDDSGSPVDLGQDLHALSWGGSTGTSADDIEWTVSQVDETHRLDVALVPANLEMPRAVYWVSGRTGTSWQEVPTFDTGNGRLATVFTTTGPPPERSGLAYIGDDEIVEAPCPTGQQCIAADELPGLADYLQNFTAGGEAKLRVAMERADEAQRILTEARARRDAATTDADRQAAEDDMAKAQAQLDAVVFPGG